MTTFLSELINLAIKNPEYGELVFLNQFAIDIRQLFPNDRLRDELRECRGKGQAHLENMLEVIKEWLHLAQVNQQENDVATKPGQSSSSRYQPGSDITSKEGRRSGVHFTRIYPEISDQDVDSEDDEE